MRTMPLISLGVALSAWLASPNASSPLVGTWRLVSFESRDATGAITQPMGSDAVGQLVYDADGNMSVHLMRANRTSFVSGDRLKGTDQEVRAAFEGYHAYFGRYSVDDGAHTVTHQVLGGSFPNLIGTEQVRVFSLAGRRLTLSTPAIKVGGRSVASTLIWERVDRGAAQQ